MSLFLPDQSATTSTPVSPDAHSYPFAAAPDIIRANQKDAYYTSQLNNHLQTVLQPLLGTRRLHKLQPSLLTISESLYLSLTTLLGLRTLGEEYTDILAVTPNSALPTPARRAAYILSTTLTPWVLARALPRLRSRLRRRVSPDSWIGRNLDALTSIDSLLALHLGVFYFWGAYYRLSARATGWRYIFTRKLGPHEVRVGYEVLGVLLLFQLCVQGWGKISELVSVEERALQSNVGAFADREDGSGDGDVEIDLENEAEMKFLPEEARKCTLCLENMKEPAVTACGHVFCWSCIGDWCRTKPECPLCRQRANVQGILRLRG